MFAYSGMSKQEVIDLREKHHIYCTLDGRISMAVSLCHLACGKSSVDVAAHQVLII